MFIHVFQHPFSNINIPDGPLVCFILLSHELFFEISTSLSIIFDKFAVAVIYTVTQRIGKEASLPICSHKCILIISHIYPAKSAETKNEKTYRIIFIICDYAPIGYGAICRDRFYQHAEFG